MAVQRLLFILFTLLVALPLSTWAQFVSDAPPPVFVSTLTAAIPLESFFTEYAQPVSTYTTVETIDGTPTTAVETAYYYGGIQATDVALSVGYIINNVSTEEYAFCWYPTSGNWARMPRVIFYGTIVFALLAREHEWLVAGALAASLTFSGVAAIQMSLQVWTKQLNGELDFFAMLGILSTSCIIAVPLLNWSSTIRYLGQSEEAKQARERRDEQLRRKQEQLRGSSIEVQAAQAGDTHNIRKHENYGPTRTVIAFWAALVSIGCLSGIVGLIWLTYEPAGTSVYLTVPAGVDSIRCVPDNNVMDLSAGQFEHWPQFYMTSEFIAANHCENPCTALPDGFWTLFRSPSNDLTTLRAKDYDNLVFQSATSKRERNSLEFASFYFNYIVFGLPFILAQGLLHFVLFRKHSPQDARQKIYLLIAGKNDKTAHPIRKGIALSLAILFYFFSVFTLLLTPFILLLNVAATEFYMWILPQSEDNKHVGQWSVAAGTLLVLVAAFLCRFDAPATRLLRAIWQASKKTAKRWSRCCTRNKRETYRVQPDTEARPHLYHKDSFNPSMAFSGILRDFLGTVRDSFLYTCDSLWWYVKDFGGLFSHEWTLFVLFWQNPGFIRPEAMVYRERPERPVRRQKKDKADIIQTSGPEGDTAARYKLVEAYPMKDMPGSRVTTYSFGGEALSPIPHEVQPPLPSHLNSSGSITALPPAARSQALSRNNTQPSSAVQSPQFLSPTPQNDHFYSAIPRDGSAQTSPNPGLTQDGGLYDAPHVSEPNPMSVLSSLTNSIAARSRRSDVYSPEPDPRYQAPLPPLPHPFLSPLNSRTSSNLFSESDLAALYSNGTPNIPSTRPSRESLATGRSTGAAVNTAHVSYLQIQSPLSPAETDSWGDQLVLKRDRQGRWVIVDPRAQSARETIHESEEIDEANDQTPPTRPREWS